MIDYSRGPWWLMVDWNWHRVGLGGHLYVGGRIATGSVQLAFLDIAFGWDARA